MNLEWSHEKLLVLISLYHEKPRLWDPNNPEYKVKTRKNDDWAEIAEEMECGELEVRKRIESLLSSFRRERTKQKCKSGAGTDEKYESTWFAFRSMNFLLDKFNPRQTIDTAEVEDNNQDAGTQSDDQIILLSSPTHPTTKSFKRKALNREEVFDSTYKILHETIASRNTKDESSSFGEYVASKHRLYSKETKTLVEKLIVDILFNADKGNYNHSTNVYTHDRHPPLIFSPTSNPSCSTAQSHNNYSHIPDSPTFKTSL